MDVLTCRHGAPESCGICGDGWLLSAQMRAEYQRQARTSPDFKRAMVQLQVQRHTRRWTVPLIRRRDGARLVLSYVPRKYR